MIVMKDDLTYILDDLNKSCLDVKSSRIIMRLLSSNLETGALADI